MPQDGETDTFTKDQQTYIYEYFKDLTLRKIVESTNSVEQFVENYLESRDNQKIFKYENATVEFRLDPLVQFLECDGDCDSEYRYSIVSKYYSVNMGYWIRSCVLSLMRALFDRPSGRCIVTKNCIEIDQ